MKPIIFLFLGTYLASQLNFEVAGGSTFCFYEPFKENEPIHVEFMVYGGGQRSILFKMTKPNGAVHTKKMTKFVNPQESGIIKINAAGAGDYGFCFDNTESFREDKRISVTTPSHQEDNKPDKNLAGGEQMNRLGRILVKMHQALEVVQARQDFMRQSSIVYGEQILSLEGRLYAWNIAETIIIMALTTYINHKIRSWFKDANTQRIDI